MLDIPRLLISGVGAGVGKTAVLLALAAAARRRGLRVAGFTFGPDGHDGPLIEAMTGRPAHGLDPWLMGRQTLRRTFARGAEGVDLALVEGAMGLFDEVSPSPEDGSTAELARCLSAPVVLVADGSALAGSVAALARGFRDFDPRLEWAGVVVNHVASGEHAALLEAALEAEGSSRWLGSLPATARLAHPPRDVGPGLRDGAWIDAARLDAAASLAELHLDVDGLLARARTACPLAVPERLPRGPRRVRIAVAMDAAFDRTFEDDLARLESAGAELVTFSPLADRALPDCEGLLLGDGAVESHSGDLAGNRDARSAVLAAVERGLPVIALGGGMLYLARGLRTLGGGFHPLAGALDLDFVATREPSAAGYVEVETTCDSIAGPAGTRMRGHAWRHALPRRTGGARDTEVVRLLHGAPHAALHASLGGGYGRTSLLALPFRTHWASSPAVPESFVAACLAAAALT